MSFQQKKKLCIFLIITLFCFTLLPILFLGKKQPRGEFITTKEVQVLTELLHKVCLSYEEEADAEERGAGGTDQAVRIGLETAYTLTDSWSAGDLTYGQFREWSEVVKTFAEIEEDFSGKYRNSFYFLKEDWYAAFDSLCTVLDPQGKIVREELLILGDHTGVKDVEGKALAEGVFFSDNGLWTNHLPFGSELLQKRGEYITYEDGLWGITAFSKEAALNNAWLLEADEGSVLYFYGNHEVSAFIEDNSFSGREQVVDISFVQGRVETITEKTEKISGEVLKLSETAIEIKGQGVYELADSVQYYRLYDSLETVGRSAIKLGYDFADFVLADGKIQAGLLVRDEQMESIRVLLKTSGFDGYYHERVELVSDVDMHLIFGEESLLIPAGERLSIEPDDEYFRQGRIFLEPVALTGRTSFASIERSQQGQGYHGSFELEKREEGILIINKVLLEEYLYAVVPSEMPGYYPMEALKAQAICARTYAYDKMLSSSLGAYGAHLDDSSAFQVYNNIQENTNTTRAVKETRGLLLYAGEEMAKTYYYSTSSGFGTNDAIWSWEDTSVLPYLQAREMTEGESRFTAEELTEEETFREYIDNPYSGHFEAEEAWYRWTYQHQEIEHILENLRTRQEKYPNNILVSEKGKDFSIGTIPDTLTLTDIQVRKRGAGGTVEELLFICKELQILVRKELHVRAILTDGESKVTLQDGKTYACRNLLPSAFFYLTLEIEGGRVQGIKLTGGGFGHGVGMSQNGAKNLALQGRSYEEILTFYYTGCQVHQP
ncbi:MAG: SpoIID/LytB domain-containing protein [Lachnospiraceae bacterium]|nr:SpoIID/LytB domain-containing protein [Lachnospiraceae bacterium]